MGTDPERLHEIWWPSAKAIEDLTVEETEGGFVLHAPDNTECGAWLSYYNESDERREAFNAAFVEMLKQHLESLKDQNGYTE